LSRWIVLGASIGALSAAALFLYRRNLADLVAPLVKVFGSTIQPPAAPSDLPRPNNSDDTDNVELAAFAPQTCGRGEIILIQALLHLPADREPARLMAVAADPATVRKAAQTLSMITSAGEPVSSRKSLV